MSSRDWVEPWLVSGGTVGRLNATGSGHGLRFTRRLQTYWMGPERIRARRVPHVRLGMSGTVIIARTRSPLESLFSRLFVSLPFFWAIIHEIVLTMQHDTDRFAFAVRCGLPG